MAGFQTKQAESLIAKHLGGHWAVRRLSASGFCATWAAERRGDRVFIKSVPLAQADVLEAEADGLAAIAASRTVRVPAVRSLGQDEDFGVTVLAVEWLDLQPPERDFGTRLGMALAQLHALAPDGDGRFGWHRDNRIGATPQRNQWHDDWIGFVAQERLGAMRARLESKAVDARLVRAVDCVIDVLPAFFSDGHRPRASLIHGDLWSGNWGALADGTPVIYDPAVSCSDAEAELAMMELFGRPPDGFWDGYREVMPLHDGYHRRRPLYQLYHLLNHALLFGGAYVQQALDVARGLTASR